MPIRPSFAFHSGELSPQMQARADLERYQTGLARCQNAIVMPTGGVTNRPGMYFLDAAASTGAVRLVPFIAADAPSASFVLEFIDQKVYFWKNGARIVDVSGTGDGLLNDPLYYTTPFTAATLETLNFQQVGDTLVICSTSYAPYRLFRVADDDWTKGYITFESWTPSTTPALVNITIYGTGSFTLARTVPWWWCYTVVNSEGKESLPSPAKRYNFVSAPPGADSDPNPDCPVKIATQTHSDAVEYRFYRGIGDTTAPGVYGYIGSSQIPYYIDRGAEPAYTEVAPAAETPFNAAGKYPRCSAFYEDRLFFGGTTQNPFALWGSKTGDYFNFDSPIFPVEDSSVLFRLAARKAEQIRTIVPLRRMVVLTSSAEWYIQGGGGAPITPFDIEARPQSYYGASDLPGLVIGDSVVFAQADYPIIRDLYYDWQLDGLKSNDLSVIASHLFRGHTIKAWDYAESPYSVIWAVRDDGVLLSACYKREYQNIGWSRHVTQGKVESLAVIPGVASDYSTPSNVYVVVERKINGSVVKNVELIANREGIYDVRDAPFLDSMRTYDYRNRAAGLTVTLSGGSTWAAGEDVTITASSGIFVAGNVGERFVVDDPTFPSGYCYVPQSSLAGSYYGAPPILLPAPYFIPPDPYDYNTYDSETDRFNDRERPVFLEIIAYSSSTSVTARLLTSVPVTLQGVATTYWAHRPKTFPPAWDGAALDLAHLEAESVGILADGSVHRDLTVASGAITLDYHATVVHVGLRYETEIQTLELAPSAVGRNKNVSRAMVKVERSRGFSMGPTRDQLTARPDKIDPTENWFPAPLETEEIEFRFQGKWQRIGQLVIRTNDPLPLTVLSIVPEFEVGN